MKKQYSVLVRIMQKDFCRSLSIQVEQMRINLIGTFGTSGSRSFPLFVPIPADCKSLYNDSCNSLFVDIFDQNNALWIPWLIIKDQGQSMPIVFDQIPRISISIQGVLNILEQVNKPSKVYESMFRQLALHTNSKLLSSFYLPLSQYPSTNHLVN